MKILVTVFALSAATIFSAQAQDTRKAPKAENRMEQVEPEQDMTKQVKMHTDKMTKDLGLNADQSKRLMEENKTLYANMANMHMENGDSEAMTKRAVAKYDAKVKDILNADQYKKYTGMKSEYMKDVHHEKMDEKSTHPAMHSKEDMPRK